MGYDSWSWLVWGRELLHLDLHTDGGPSWKPLPPLLLAPFTVIDGLAPPVWLAMSRTAAFAALLFAHRVAWRLTSSHAVGAFAAVAVALGDDFFVTALRGYSEPLLIALALGAVDRHLHGHRTTALGLGVLAGLLRPEVWPFVAVYGALLLRRGNLPTATPLRRWMIVALAVGAPTLWLGLDLLGSGNALQSSDVAQTSPLGSAAKSDNPALTVLERAGDAVILPVLLLALVGLALSVARRRTAEAVVSVMAMAWIAIVAVMAEAGFTGRRRYLAVAAAFMCVSAAGGLHALLERAHTRQVRQIALVVVAVVLLAFAFSPARTSYRLLTLARDQDAQLDELRQAVVDVGGPEAVRRRRWIVINPFVHTALAWEIDSRLVGVRPTWSSTRRRPGWTPPAIVFRAPPKLAGTRPAVRHGTAVRLLTTSGRWRVLEATGPQR